MPDADGAHGPGEYERLRESSHVNSPIPLLILGAQGERVVKSPKTDPAAG